MHCSHHYHRNMPHKLSYKKSKFLTSTGCTASFFAIAKDHLKKPLWSRLIFNSDGLQWSFNNPYQLDLCFYFQAIFDLVITPSTVFIESMVWTIDDNFTTLLLVVTLINDLYRICSRNAWKLSIFFVWFKDTSLEARYKSMAQYLPASRISSGLLVFYCKISVPFVLNQNLYPRDWKIAFAQKGYFWEISEIRFLIKLLYVFKKLCIQNKSTFGSHNIKIKLGSI